MTDIATRYETARDALELAPDIVEHIVAQVTVKSRPAYMDTDGAGLVGRDAAAIAPSAVRTARVHAPAPLNEGAFNDANELYGRLAHWAGHWGKELRTPAPAVPQHAPRSSWTVVGLPADTDPEAAREATHAMTTWLLAHLEEIFRRNPDDVDYFVTELTEVHQAAMRYPMNVQPRWTALHCRITGCAGTVALWPFTEVKTWQQEGQHVYLPPEGARVRCEECHDRWTPDEYTEEVNRRVYAAKEQQKAERVQQRLLKKYAAPTAFPLFLGTVAGKVRHRKPETPDDTQ